MRVSEVISSDPCDHMSFTKGGINHKLGKASSQTASWLQHKIFRRPVYDKYRISTYNANHEVLSPWESEPVSGIDIYGLATSRPLSNTQRTQDAILTPLWCQNHIAMLFWRHNHFVIASCARWACLFIDCCSRSVFHYCFASYYAVVIVESARCSLSSRLFGAQASAATLMGKVCRYMPGGASFMCLWASILCLKIQTI